MTVISHPINSKVCGRLCGGVFGTRGKKPHSGTSYRNVGRVTHPNTSRLRNELLSLWGHVEPEVVNPVEGEFDSLRMRRLR